MVRTRSGDSQVTSQGDSQGDFGYGGVLLLLKFSEKNLPFLQSKLVSMKIEHL